MMRPALGLVPLLALATGCSFTLGKSYPIVDGVRLKAKHVETLELPAVPSQGLSVDAAVGDVRVASGPGPLHVVVEVYGTVVGDGHAEIVDGVLVARSATSKPVALGAVTIRCADPFPRLALTTGMGDIEVRGVRVLESLVMETGTGDVVAEDVGEPVTLRASSGMGDVDLARSSPHSIDLSSGMGDVTVVSVVAADAHLESGMGDVRLNESRFDTVEATTGMGDVECRGTTYTKGDLDSGLGSVER